MNEIPPQKRNIPIPPNMQTMPNIQNVSPEEKVQEDDKKKEKIKLNSQAKTILLAMFSAITFLGAIACFVLMLVL